MVAATESLDSRDDLFRRIEGRRDEVAALTAALIAIPTVNPPGDAYEQCSHDGVLRFDDNADDGSGLRVVVRLPAG